MSEDIFKGLGVRVKLKASFGKILDALTRIGLPSKNKELVQSCHLFHKRGEYAIMHFLEMFHYDGKEANFTEEDSKRRDAIVNLLVEWDMIEVLDNKWSKPDNDNRPHVTILTKKDSEGWNLVKKYTIGKSAA